MMNIGLYGIGILSGGHFWLLVSRDSWRANEMHRHPRVGTWFLHLLIGSYMWPIIVTFSMFPNNLGSCFIWSLPLMQCLLRFCCLTAAWTQKIWLHFWMPRSVTQFLNDSCNNWDWRLCVRVGDVHLLPDKLLRGSCVVSYDSMQWLIKLKTMH